MPTHRKKSAFLTAYRNVGNIRWAAEVADIERKTHYYWLRTDAEYATAFRAATEEAADLLEAEARRRAVEGVEKPVGWHKGQAGGVVREYSDALLIFLLKGLRPEKYREQPSMLGTHGPLEIVIRDETTDGRARELFEGVPVDLPGAEVVDME